MIVYNFSSRAQYDCLKFINHGGSVRLNDVTLHSFIRLYKLYFLADKNRIEPTNTSLMDIKIALMLKFQTSTALNHGKIL